MSNDYDTIVIGLGAMGSTAAYHLSKRGQRALGLDAYPRLHTRGSSHGRSRIIRQVYKEAAEYVPLVQRSYELWRELEQESGRTLLTVIGGLTIGERGGAVAEGVARSAQQHGLPYEELSSDEVAARFPAFNISDELVAIFDPMAGVLAAEECVVAHQDLAIEYGAELHHEEPVRHWKAGEDGIRVETDAGVYGAERLVVTTGPWAGEFLSGLALPLSVERVVNVHFEPTKPELVAPDRCPVYTLSVPEGSYYGVPALPGQGVKIGRHDGGEPCTARTIRPEVDSSEVEMLRSTLESYLPGAAGPVKWSLTCMYTNTPDGHFIVDRHPEHGQVSYACGFSGHGFKFASVMGEVMADLAMCDETEHPIGFLAASRFG